MDRGGPLIHNGVLIGVISDEGIELGSNIYLHYHYRIRDESSNFPEIVDGEEIKFKYISCVKYALY